MNALSLADPIPDGPLLSVRDLSVTYQGSARRALEAVSFDIPREAVVALVGESGSGKSTIGQALLGMLPADAEVSGNILWADGESRSEILDLSRNELREYRRTRVSAIPQEPRLSLNPAYTVRHQLKQLLRLYGDADPGDDVYERVLRRAGFGDPAAVLGRYPHELSGGMCQRVLIAMSWLSSPGLIVADEPTSALDTTAQNKIMREMIALRNDLRCSILFITHDLDLAALYSDEIVVLEQGVVQDNGRSAEVIQNPTSPYTAHLVSIRQRPPRSGVSHAEKRETILVASDVSKRFTARKGRSAHDVLKGVSLEIGAGECVALVGESGSGKSTLSRILLGLEKVDSGSVSWFGTPLESLKRQEFRRLRSRMQFVHQNPYGSLDPRLTIEHIVGEPLLTNLSGFWDVAARKRAVGDALESVRLPDAVRKRRPHELSGGQRQRVAIARALIVDPAIVILDEPTSALDVSVEYEILNLLDSLRAEKHISYLFISHDLGVVQSISDRVVVLAGGRVVEEGRTERVFADPQDEMTKALIAAIPEPRFGTAAVDSSSVSR